MMELTVLRQPEVTLRPYQEESLAAVERCFAERPDAAPLLVLPTGAGKSLILAELARRQLAGSTAGRVIVATHVQELVLQNYAQTRRLWPAAPAGIYAASLGRKDRSRLVFGLVQSLARRPQVFGQVDMLIVDECHLVPHESEGQYHALIRGLREHNPALRIVGLTATPWRLNSGNLVEPYKDNPPLFTEIAHEVTLLELLVAGYLSPLVARRTSTRLSTEGVKTRGGEFVEADLDRVVNKEEINAAIVRETVAAGEDRRAWLVFCVTIDHAQRLAALFREAGVDAQAISGETPKAERARIINEFKLGRIRCLTSVNVLGTGFDAPHVDLICMARPTKSPGLYLQQAGRGLRLSPGKQNCLLLDFAGNVMRHGLVDQVQGVFKKAKDEDEDVLVCARCQTINSKQAVVCSQCGASLIQEREPSEAPDRETKLSTRNLADRVASDLGECRWVDVHSAWADRHRKEGMPDSMRVTYEIDDESPVSEWVCFEHEGYPAKKAVEWWRKRSSGKPPATVTEALERLGELRLPRRALVSREGRFLKIVAVGF